MALRLYQIQDQILLDDEWHALRSLVWYGYGHLLTHFGTFDHCIPLAVYDRLLMDTIGPSELGMRLPVLLSGIAALVALPLLVRRLAGSTTAVVFSALLAMSPVHIFFSRYARPYAISLLLSSVAVIGFYIWWRDGRRRWAATYCLAGAAAAYFHLAALPFVLAPLLWAILDALGGSKPGAGVATIRIASAGGGLAMTLAVLLGPPLITDSTAIMKKVGRGGAIDIDSLRGALEILLGTGSLPPLLALVGLALIGMAILWRGSPGLASYMTTLLVVQAACYRIAAPLMGETPYVIARYHLWLLPLLLLFVARGMAAAGETLRARWASWPASGAGWLCATALLGVGPLPASNRTPNAWTNHGLYQHAYRSNRHVRTSQLEPVRFSPFYDELRRREPGSVTVLEAPWNFKWYLNPYPFFQQYHRQQMKIGFTVRKASKYLGYGELLPAQRGVDLRNAVHVSSIETIRELGVDYVIFHRDLWGELPQRLPEPLADVSSWIAAYREIVGVPVHQDSDIVVFKIK